MSVDDAVVVVAVAIDAVGVVQQDILVRHNQLNYVDEFERGLGHVLNWIQIQLNDDVDDRHELLVVLILQSLIFRLLVHRLLREVEPVCKVAIFQ